MTRAAGFRVGDESGPATLCREAPLGTGGVRTGWHRVCVVTRLAWTMPGPVA